MLVPALREKIYQLIRAANQCKVHSAQKSPGEHEVAKVEETSQVIYQQELLWQVCYGGHNNKDNKLRFFKDTFICTVFLTFVLFICQNDCKNFRERQYFTVKNFE